MKLDLKFLFPLMGLTLFCGLELAPTSAFAVGPINCALNTTVDRIKTPYLLRDQGETNTCWLHSALQMMEQAAGMPLSVDALLIPEIKSRALIRFLGYETPWDGGAGPTRPFALALEHGLVPDSVWKSKKSIVQNYAKIFREIETLLSKQVMGADNAISATTRAHFLAGVDKIILKYTGTKPPENFQVNGRQVSAVDFARETTGGGDSRGYDFRPVKFSDKLYPLMPQQAWTTVISRQGGLKKITDIIQKRTVHTTADEAFNIAVEIFEQKRPVAFTFIFADKDGHRVLGLNTETQTYVSVAPPVNETYTSSHLVLISGIIRDQSGRAIGFEVLDSLAGNNGRNGIRTITREFFNAHGKTVHEIAPVADCGRILSKGS